MMVGCDVFARIHRQHRESFRVTMLAPDAGNAKPVVVVHREQPLIEAFLLGILRVGKLVESIGVLRQRCESKARPSDRKL